MRVETRLHVRRLGVVLLLILAVATGCTHITGGHAVSVYHDPFTVGGMPATSGPSGLRPAVQPARLPVDGGTSDRIDTIAVDAVADVQRYWSTAFPETFHKPFHPVDKLYSWNAAKPGEGAPRFCGDSTDHLVNAGYCTLDNTIGWDRGTLMPTVVQEFGPMAEVAILAHEYGHAVQRLVLPHPDSEPTLVLEQQADCYAGAFIRHVAEGRAEHFTLNTSDGLNKVLAAMVSTRDVPDAASGFGARHGTAFERVTAFQFGFTSGPLKCDRITADEIDARRGDLPQGLADPGRSGEMPVDPRSLQQVLTSLRSVFPLAHPPTLQFAAGAGACPVHDHAAAYCPDAHTIEVDLHKLQARAKPAGGHDFPTAISGDFTAFVLVASRYALAVQQAAGQSLAGASAALRTACLSGAWAGAAATGQGGLMLSPGDLDEAVSGLLSDGLVAGDIHGATVPSGFSRVDAFRSGVLGGPDLCTSRYS